MYIQFAFISTDNKIVFNGFVNFHLQIFLSLRLGLYKK